MIHQYSVWQLVLLNSEALLLQSFSKKLHSVNCQISQMLSNCTKFSSKLSQNTSEFSQNWKALCSQLESDKKPKISPDVDDVNKVFARKRRRTKPKRNRKRSKMSDVGAEGNVESCDKISDLVDSKICDRKHETYASAVKSTKPSDIQSCSHSENAPVASRLTKCLALDCEFVGVGDNGMEDMVARVSLVNLFGECVYNKYVKPEEEIIDYRTKYSGIRPENLINATTLQVVQKEVSDLLKGRILIGHSIHKDLQVLFLSHPRYDIRDTSTYPECRTIAKTRRPSLKKLASLVLGISIQEGEHNSITDARVAMQLYRTFRRNWEASCKQFKVKKNREISNSLIAV